MDLIVRRHPTTQCESCTVAVGEECIPDGRGATREDMANRQSLAHSNSSGGCVQGFYRVPVSLSSESSDVVPSIGSWQLQKSPFQISSCHSPS